MTTSMFKTCTRCKNDIHWKEFKYRSAVCNNCAAIISKEKYYLKNKDRIDAQRVKEKEEKERAEKAAKLAVKDRYKKAAETRKRNRKAKQEKKAKEFEEWAVTLRRTTPINVPTPPDSDGIHIPGVFPEKSQITTLFPEMDIHTYGDVPPEYFDEKHKRAMGNLLQNIIQYEGIHKLNQYMKYAHIISGEDTFNEAFNYCFYFPILSDFYAGNWTKFTSTQDLYLIHDGESLKIGRSMQTPARMRDLQVSNKNPLTLLHNIPNRGCCEFIMHKHFKHLRLRGEWFKYSQDIINFYEQVKQNTTFSNSDGEGEDFPHFQNEVTIYSHKYSDILQHTNPEDTEKINYWRKIEAQEKLDKYNNRNGGRPSKKIKTPIFK